ncbi:hypothetical protein [Henriciella barbarensis]|uniref:hypothetical protein n=1 Tax=Henriciella barbarensis TaxID=86342 RepID=UPI001F367367|nr:hypothetical protein [Henriciella barbarensis]
MIMRVLAVLAAGLMLAACGSNPLTRALDSRQNAGPCPPVAALYDASRIVEFSGDTNSFHEITYTGEITGVDLVCRYLDDQPMRAEVEIDFAFGKGPQADSNRHTYRYWVAVTRRSSKVLAKQYFTVDANFAGNTIDGRREVVQDILVPRADETISGSNFEVIVGFDLTDEQLAFNREGRRFRLDAGS